MSTLNNAVSLLVLHLRNYITILRSSTSAANRIVLGDLNKDARPSLSRNSLKIHQSTLCELFTHANVAYIYLVCRTFPPRSIKSLLFCCERIIQKLMYCTVFRRKSARLALGQLRSFKHMCIMHAGIWKDNGYSHGE